MNAPFDGATRLLHGIGTRPPAASERAPAQLVLFVGAAPRLDRGLAELLAQAGIRGAWIAGLAPAIGASAQMRFDALVVEAAALEPSAAVALAALRQQLDCPVLVVAAGQGDEIDEIVALEHGASGYLGAPLSPRRLRAHLLAHLRQAAPTLVSAHPPVLRPHAFLAGWALDTLSRELQGHGRGIPLTECQFALLQGLAAQPGCIVTRAELLERVVPFGAGLGPRSIDVYVHRLRRRLANHRIAEFDIEAVRGRGYRLKAAAAATLT